MLKILAMHALLTLSATPSLEVDTVLRVSRGTRLDLDTSGQPAVIRVRAWDRDEVSVESPAALRVSTAGAVVRLGPAQNQPQGRAGQRGGRGGREQTSYEVRVPAWMPITIDANRGDITIEGTAADVSVETVGGTIRITGGEGRVSARSVDGAVIIENTRGRVDASSTHQAVRVSNVSGDVRVQTVNGSIRLERVDSRSVDASSTNGSVDFDGPVRDDGRYRLSSHNGRVSATVQEGANVTIGVATFNGRYSSTFPVAITEMGSDRRFTFVVGRGTARLDATSFNGNVELRRPGPRPVS